MSGCERSRVRIGAEPLLLFSSPLELQALRVLCAREKPVHALRKPLELVRTLRRRLAAAAARTRSRLAELA